MPLTLLTSGTTKEPKTVVHSWDYIEKCIQRSIEEIKLTQSDVVLDVFPANTIAHYTVTAMPAFRAGAQLVSAKFEAIDYLQRFNQCRPTYIALIPRHWEILKEHVEWNNMDLSCVRYMVTGSGPVSQTMIDDFLNKGVQTVANWYGMTEMPPPVFVGYNTSSFDFTARDGYSVEFTDEGECIINGFYTGDLFDTNTKVFCNRKTDTLNINTWKNS
jgi:long-subunit acyl-CoA synthetase (AMP-forming)